MAVRVLITDDEPIARDILAGYVAKVPSLELAGMCKNAIELTEALNKTDVDLLLLDINMPEISGMEILKTLHDPPAVIFVTAHAEYAVESYELNVIDYLLKPVSFSRFVAAVNKVIHAPAHTNVVLPPAEESFFVKSDGKLVKVDPKQVLFVEGLRDYVKMHLEDGVLLVHSTMKNMEEQLSVYPGFVRVHKSHIVNLAHVREIEGNMIRIAGHTIVIGNTYRDTIPGILSRFRLL